MLVTGVGDTGRQIDFGAEARLEVDTVPTDLSPTTATSSPTRRLVYNKSLLSCGLGTHFLGSNQHQSLHWCSPTI
jgi:hypothetical protein